MRALLIACAAILLGMAASTPTGAQESGGEPERSWFAVQITTGPNWDPAISPYEQPFFKEHSAHLQKLRADGHIVMGTRYSDIGLLIFHTDSIDAINKLMVADPSMQAGTFTYEVHAMNIFYPGFVGTKK